MTWTNHDDIVHNAEGKLKSAALDTDDKFQFRITEAGESRISVEMHPKMTGSTVVQSE